MLIRNLDDKKTTIVCYKVNKKLSDYLVMNRGLSMFAMGQKGEYYFIKNNNSDNAINNIPLSFSEGCEYEIVGREVNKIG